MDISYQAIQVKQYDRDRYVCCLFTNKKNQENLFTIISFQNELDLIIHSDKDLLAKLIRLTWWQENIDKLYKGDIEQQPTLIDLARIIKEFNLPQNLFKEIFKSKFIEVHGDIPEEKEALKEFVRKDGYNNLKMMALVLGSLEQTEQLENIGLAWNMLQKLRFSEYSMEVAKIMLEIIEDALQKLKISELKKNTAPIDLLYFLAKIYLQKIKVGSARSIKAVQNFYINPLKKQLLLSYHYLLDLH